MTADRGRHPLAPRLSASLPEFVRGLGPTEEAIVRAALADNLPCARYGQVVVTYGHRRAHLPGKPPASLGGMPLNAVITPGDRPENSEPVSPLKRHLQSADRVLGTPRKVDMGQTQDSRTEVPQVSLGSSRTSPDPRAGSVSPSELLRTPKPQPRKLTPEQAWYQGALGR